MTLASRAERRSTFEKRARGFWREQVYTHTSRARLLLSQDRERAQVEGPSGFTSLHAAALTDSHRVVNELVALSGVAPDQQVAALDGPAAIALRQFLREHSKLPSSKLCAVF